MKSYNNLTDHQKKIIREYWSWAKSTAPIGHKLFMCEKYMKFAFEENIQHLILQTNSNKGGVR